MANDTTTTTNSNTVALVLAWAWVGVPLAWGLLITIRNATALFAK
jgi:hypothetical protein